MRLPSWDDEIYAWATGLQRLSSSDTMSLNTDSMLLEGLLHHMGILRAEGITSASMLCCS